MPKSFSLGRGLSSLIPRRTAPPTPAADVSSGGVTDLGRIHDVPIGHIQVNPRQPRHHFDHAELESLVASIREHGIVQPLVARKIPGGGYELIAGERRLRASQMLGLTSVPVIVREVRDDKDKLLVALVENLNRQDLNAIEEAQAYALLSDEFGLTQEDIGKRVGKARPTIANLMRLLQLPAEMQKAVIQGSISTAQAKVLASIDEPAAQQKLFSAMLGGGVTVRVAEEAARTKKMVSLPNAQAASDAEALRQKLGTKVVISGAGLKGAIKIAYFSPEEYREVLKKLGAR